SAVMLPDGSSLDQTQKVVEEAEAFFQSHPAVRHVTSMIGFDLLTGGTSSTNAATLFVALKPFEERTGPGLSAAEVAAASRSLAGRVTQGIVLAFSPPAIPGLGTRAGFTLELQQRAGGSTAELAEVLDHFLEAARADGRITGLSSSLRVTLPQVFVDLNREKTRMMGVRLA